MTTRRLPPLHTLIAFEASARHLSFKLAAEELHLTPSAISHQIKTLESSLGLTLFERGNRHLALTDAGRDYAAVVRESLNRLRNGTDRIRRRHIRGRLRISVGPFIANEVIVPALESFQDMHPDIDVIVDTDLRTADLTNDDVDVALRFGRGNWQGLTAHLLLDAIAVPVCSPALAAILGQRPPGDIHDITLIHSTPIPQGWEIWSQGTGVTLKAPKRDMWLDSYLAILSAAEQGVGLCIGILPMVTPWLRSGQLAMPWPDLTVPIDEHYYLVHRELDDDRPEIRSFVAWVRQLLQEQTGSEPH